MVQKPEICRYHDIRSYFQDWLILAGPRKHDRGFQLLLSFLRPILFLLVLVSVCTSCGKSGVFVPNPETVRLDLVIPKLGLGYDPAPLVELTGCIVGFSVKKRLGIPTMFPVSQPKWQRFAKDEDNYLGEVFVPAGDYATGWIVLRKSCDGNSLQLDLNQDVINSTDQDVHIKFRTHGKNLEIQEDRRLYLDMTEKWELIGEIPRPSLSNVIQILELPPVNETN